MWLVYVCGLSIVVWAKSIDIWSCFWLRHEFTYHIILRRQIKTILYKLLLPRSLIFIKTGLPLQCWGKLVHFMISIFNGFISIILTKKLVDFSVTWSTFCVMQPTFCMLRLTRQLRRQKLLALDFFFTFSKFFWIFYGEKYTFLMAGEPF